MGDVLQSAGALRSLSFVSFWSQLALSLTSALVFAFSMAFSRTASSEGDPTKYLTLVGILFSFLSTFFAHGFYNLAQKVAKGEAIKRAWVVSSLLRCVAQRGVAGGGSCQAPAGCRCRHPAAAGRAAAATTNGRIRPSTPHRPPACRNSTLNFLGIGATLVGLQAAVGARTPWPGPGRVACLPPQGQVARGEEGGRAARDRAAQRSARAEAAQRGAPRPPSSGGPPAGRACRPPWACPPWCRRWAP
jgi:hypothetical protein